jgi:hypothetical protein
MKTVFAVRVRYANFPVCLCVLLQILMGPLARPEWIKIAERSLVEGSDGTCLNISAGHCLLPRVMSFASTVQICLHGISLALMIYGYNGLGRLAIDSWIQTQYGGHLQFLTIQGLVERLFILVLLMKTAD